MKLLLLTVAFFVLGAFPIYAQENSTADGPPGSPDVAGLYDEDTTVATDSATASATVTPEVRATTYLDPTDAPVSGSFETSLFLLLGGISFMFLGFRFTRSL